MSGSLCVDLGGTNLRAGLRRQGAGATVTPVGRWPAPTSLDGFTTQLGALIDAHRVDRIGICVPGLVSGTQCVWVPNLPYLDGVELEALFPGMIVAAGNDAHFALLAEAAEGAAAKLSNAILVAMGTGIGSAVLSDGRIVRGHKGGATSFGWASLDPGDPGDPTHGWLERTISGRALDRLARSSGLAVGSDLIRAARVGDAKAIRLLESPAEALGAALSGAVALLGAEAVLISGGLAEALDIIAPRAQAVLRRHLPPHLRHVEIVKGAFETGASLIGAGLAAEGHALWKGSVR